MPCSFASRLGQADARDLGIGEGGPGDHRVVGLERRKRPNSALTAAYQAWCAAVWVNWNGPATSPHGVDVRVRASAGRRWSRSSSSRSARCRAPPARSPVTRGLRPDGAQQLVEGDARSRRRRCSTIRRFSPPSRSHAHRLVAGEQRARRRRAAIAATSRRDLRVLAAAGCAAPSRPASPAAPSRAKLCASSLPIGPPPSTTRRAGSSRQAPDRVAGQEADLLRPGIGGTNGSRRRR